MVILCLFCSNIPLVPNSSFAGNNTKIFNFTIKTFYYTYCIIFRESINDNNFKILYPTCLEIELSSFEIYLASFNTGITILRSSIIIKLYLYFYELIAVERIRGLTSRFYCHLKHR